MTQGMELMRNYFKVLHLLEEIIRMENEPNKCLNKQAKK